MTTTVTQGRFSIVFLLFFALGADVTVRFWHWHKTTVLRQEYRARHGTIDVPEAMYFDGLALMVQTPVLLVFMALQVGSAVVLCRDRHRITRKKLALLWCLWLTTWPLCLFGPMLIGGP